MKKTISLLYGFLDGRSYRLAGFPAMGQRRIQLLRQEILPGSGVGCKYQVLGGV